MASLASSPQNKNNSGVYMHPYAVSKLVPGIIIRSQAVNEKRVVLFVWEWRSPWPWKYGVYLIENFQLVETLSGLTWSAAEELFSSTWHESGRDNNKWWDLILERMGDTRGAAAA